MSAHSLREHLDRAFTHSPCVVVLRHIDALSRQKMGNGRGTQFSIMDNIQHLTRILDNALWHGLQESVNDILGARDTIIVATMSDATAMAESPVFVMDLEQQVRFCVRNLQGLKILSRRPSPSIKDSICYRNNYVVMLLCISQHRMCLLCRLRHKQLHLLHLISSLLCFKQGSILWRGRF